MMARMTSSPRNNVALRLWSDADFWLLERSLGDPLMMRHLGGPETPEQLRKRHARYCAAAEAGKMFVIVAGTDAVGSVGYWEHDRQGELVWETGWSVLPEFQKRGLATAGIVAVVEQVRAERRYRFLHAFPSTENLPSNAVCQKAGFMLVREVEFEYPRGHLMQCNDWRLDLYPTAETPPHP